GAAGGRSDESADDTAPATMPVNANGGNMSALLNALETSWGDVGLMLSIPYQGLGNAAIAAVATDEQLERFGKVWASMAITEPSRSEGRRVGHGAAPTPCTRAAR